MEAEYYKKYEPFFGGWYIKALLGEGGYGKVFQIERRDTFGTVFESALKVITIPPNKGGIEDAMAEGMDQNSAAIYFQDCVKELNREIVLMSRLKGHSNIVSYEDHSIIQHEDGIGWDILIRMELLTPITRFLKDNRFFSRRRVVQMGIDLCRALELCQKYDIIHRDIKPANIFLSEAGDFKLGDFGVARVTSAATAAYTRVGTMNYMAPEVFAGKEYSRNVDIYSLGLVMYQLLNGNRMPFYPPYPQPITFAEQERAHARRLGGEKLPAPANAPEKLAKIVLKACAPDPAKRYSGPAQMRRELEAVLPMFKETAQETVQPPMSDSTTLPLQQPVSMARDEMTTVWSQSGSVAQPKATAPAAQTQKPHNTASRPAAVPVPVKKQGGAKLPILLGTAAVVAVVAVAGGLALTTGSSGHALPTAEPAEAVTSSSEAASEERPASSEEAASASVPESEAASEEEASASVPEGEPARSESENTVESSSASSSSSVAPSSSKAVSSSSAASSSKPASSAASTSKTAAPAAEPAPVASSTAPAEPAQPAANVVASGTCGTNVNWTLDENGLLTISGSGKMTSYPWEKYKNQIYTVKIQNGVSSITSYAFWEYKSLTSVTIPGSVTDIGDCAFKNCTSLASVTISNGVKNIGDSAFWGCTSLTSVTIPSSVEKIEKWAFYKCSALQSVTIPGSVQTIEENAFANCTSLSSVTIGNGVNVIGNGAFWSCEALTSVVIPGSVSKVEKTAFLNCTSLSSVTIPASVMEIGRSAFGGCNLTEVTINRNCKSAFTAFDSGVQINYYD